MPVLVASHTGQAARWRRCLKHACGVWLVAWLIAVAALDAAHGQGKPASKVTDDLKVLHAEHAAAIASGSDYRWTDPLLPVAGDWVTLDAVASGDPNALAADLVAFGAQDVVVAGRIVSA